jgi:hypothetical protein
MIKCFKHSKLIKQIQTPQLFVSSSHTTSVWNSDKTVIFLDLTINSGSGVGYSYSWSLSSTTILILLLKGTEYNDYKW